MVLDAAQGPWLAGFVATGGTVVGCAKSAHLDPWGGFHHDLGGPLADLFGRCASHGDPIAGGTPARWGDEACPIEAWNERMDAVSGEVLARLDDGTVAACRRRHGRGTAIYLPCWSDRLCELAIDASLVDAAVPTALAQAGLGMVPDPLGRGRWHFNDSATPLNVAGRNLAPGSFALIA